MLKTIVPTLLLNSRFQLAFISRSRWLCFWSAGPGALCSIHSWWVRPHLEFGAYWPTVISFIIYNFQSFGTLINIAHALECRKWFWKIPEIAGFWAEFGLRLSHRLWWAIEMNEIKHHLNRVSPSSSTLLLNKKVVRFQKLKFRFLKIKIFNFDNICNILQKFEVCQSKDRVKLHTILKNDNCDTYLASVFHVFI